MQNLKYYSDPPKNSSSGITRVSSPEGDTNVRKDRTCRSGKENGVTVQVRETAAESVTRKLKIEEHWNSFKGMSKPKIRLIGRWLERAGFRAGSHVHVTCVGPGILELRSSSRPQGKVLQASIQAEMQF